MMKFPLPLWSQVIGTDSNARTCQVPLCHGKCPYWKKLDLVDVDPAYEEFVGFCEYYGGIIEDAVCAPVVDLALRWRRLHQIAVSPTVSVADRIYWRSYLGDLDITLGNLASVETAIFPPSL